MKNNIKLMFSVFFIFYSLSVYAKDCVDKTKNIKEDTQLFYDKELNASLNKDVILTRNTLNDRFTSESTDGCVVSYADPDLQNSKVTAQANVNRKVEAVRTTYFNQKPTRFLYEIERTIYFTDDLRVTCIYQNVPQDDDATIPTSKLLKIDGIIPKTFWCDEFDDNQEIKIKHQPNVKSEDSTVVL